MLYYVPMLCRAVLYKNFEVIFLDISHSFQIVLHHGTLLYWNWIAPCYAGKCLFFFILLVLSSSFQGFVVGFAIL